MTTAAKTADIENAINDLPKGSTVQFSSGDFRITAPLEITRGDITIKGAGQDATKFILDFNPSLGTDGISIKGETGSWTGGLQQSIASGSTVITLSSTAGLKAGDVLYIGIKNTGDFWTSGTYDNVLNNSNAKDNPLRESMGEIASINGNVVTLKHAVVYDMEPGMNTIVQKIDVLRNVSVSDFSMTYDLPGVPDANDFSSPLSAYEDSLALNIRYTQGVEISNITINNAASHALEVRDALDAHVNNYTADGAFNKGGGGNGYGLHIAGSFYGTYENLTITDVRHAVIFSSWNAEAHNDVHVLYTNRDINFHGSPDHSNMVVVDRMEYESGMVDAWMAVSPGSDMHPYTDIPANTVLFKYVSGGWHNDIITGHDSGSIMLGNDGNDTITGGIGHDFIEGGHGNDILTGGSGTDEFIFKRGDRADVITDFQTGPGGDVLYINDYYGLVSTADLNFIQKGADTELVLNKDSTGTDSILFRNITVAELQAAQIVFASRTDAIASDITLTNASDYVVLGKGADFIRTTTSAFDTDDIIRAGAGKDTVVFSAAASLSLDTGNFLKMSGIEILDFSQIQSLALSVRAQMVAGTDSGKCLTIQYGDGGIGRLDTSSVSSDSHVYLKGTGNVFLAPGVTSRVSINNDTLGNVQGSNGQDYFRIYGGRGIVDGGASNDTFYISGQKTGGTINGGDGNDFFQFARNVPTVPATLNGGAGIDEIRFYTVINYDADQVNSIQGIERLNFSVTGSSFSLTDSFMNGEVTVLASAAGVGVTFDLSSLTESAVIKVEKHINVSLSGETNALAHLILTDAATGSVSGSSGADRMTGNARANTINGNAGNDDITGGLGNDILSGGDGRDTFRMITGDGQDTITDFQSGSGGDIIILKNFFATRNFSELSLSQEGSDTRVRLSPTDTILLKNVQSSALTADNFVHDNTAVINLTLKPTTGADRLVTGAGADRIEAYTSSLTAADIIDTGTGADTLVLKSGAYSFDSTIFTTIRGIDVLDATGPTSLPGMIIGDNLASGSDAKDLKILFDSTGISGLDTSRVNTASNVTLEGTGAVSLAAGVNNRVTLSAAGQTNLTGNTGDDYIRLRGGAHTVNGGDGNDTLAMTGAGRYTLAGGDGNDIVQGASVLFKNIVFDGGAGIDEIRITDAASLSRADLAGVTGIERLILGVNNSVIQLAGGMFESQIEIRGSSTMINATIDIAGLGPDKSILISSNIHAGFTGLAGETYAFTMASNANGSLRGTDGQDIITGSTANDVLYGLDGDDIFLGGRGVDMMTGGNGQDTFRYTNANEFGDVIRDFSTVIGDSDVLDLTELFNANGLGTVSTEDALARGYVTFQQAGADMQVLFDRDGSAASKYAPTLLATLEAGNAGLLTADMLVV